MKFLCKHFGHWWRTIIDGRTISFRLGINGFGDDLYLIHDVLKCRWCGCQGHRQYTPYSDGIITVAMDEAAFKDVIAKHIEQLARSAEAHQKHLDGQDAAGVS